MAVTQDLATITAENVAAGDKIIGVSSGGDTKVINADSIAGGNFGTAAAKDVGTAAGNLVELDSNAKFPASSIPSITLGEFKGIIANEAAMLALTAETNDWCHRQDTSTHWVLTGTNPATLAHWTQMTTPADAVSSVAGRTGAVSLDKTDVGLGSVDNTTDASKPISTAVQTSLNTKVASSDIVTNLITDDDTKPLAAKQGKLLEDNKVDKIAGKGLSSVDFTSADNTKIDGIELGAQANVQSDWNQTTGSADDYIKNKPTIPPAAIDWTTDQGNTNIHSNNYTDTDTTYSAATTSANGLMSSADKTKLDGVTVGTSAGDLVQLDSNAKFPASSIPSIAISEFKGIVASEAIMLALTAETNDYCHREDTSTNWILTGTNPATLAHWTQLTTPVDLVSSVAGRTGAVTLDKADVGLVNVDNTTDASKPISTAAQTALDAKVASSDIVTNLTTDDNAKPLAAKQGKLLQDNKVDKIADKGLSSEDFTSADKNYLTSFNAANKLVKADANGKYPALDGSNITGITSSATTVPYLSSSVSVIFVKDSTATVSFTGDNFLPSHTLLNLPTGYTQAAAVFTSPNALTITVTAPEVITAANNAITLSSHLSTIGAPKTITFETKEFGLEIGQAYYLTDCGATGKDGPSSSQFTSEYSSQSTYSTVIYSILAGVQTLRITNAGLYEITARGAGGTDHNGNVSYSAAKVVGRVSISADEYLHCVVGQIGTKTNNQTSGDGTTGATGGASYIGKSTSANGTVTTLFIGSGGPAEGDADYSGAHASPGAFAVLNSSTPTWPTAFTGISYTRVEVVNGGFGKGKGGDDSKEPSTIQSYHGSVANSVFISEDGTTGGSSAQNGYKGWIEIKRIS